MVKTPYGDHRDWPAIQEWAASIARELADGPGRRPNMTTIETQRLVVRPFRPDDWQDLHAYLSLPEIYEFEPGEPVDAEQARALADERSQGAACSGPWSSGPSGG